MLHGGTVVIGARLIASGALGTVVTTLRPVIVAGLVAALRTVVTAGTLLVTALRAVIVVARLIGTVMLESFMAFSVGRCIFYITVCIE